LPRRAHRLARYAALTDDEARILVNDCFAAIQANSMIVPEVAYAPLEAEARWRVERAPHDWPIVAFALTLGAAIWTDGGDVLGCGVATWTTRTLSRALGPAEPTGMPAPDTMGQ
jgi:predicted nucleic acid-binding protein